MVPSQVPGARLQDERRRGVCRLPRPTPVRQPPPFLQPCARPCCLRLSLRRAADRRVCRRRPQPRRALVSRGLRGAGAACCPSSRAFSPLPAISDHTTHVMWRASSPRSPSLSGVGEGFPGMQVGPVSVSAGCDPTYSIAYWWPVLGHEQRSAIWKQIWPVFRVSVAQQLGGDPHAELQAGRHQLGRRRPAQLGALDVLRGPARGAAHVADAAGRDADDAGDAGLGVGERVGDPGGGVARAARVRRRGARNEGRRGGGALSACVGRQRNFPKSRSFFVNANLSLLQLLFVSLIF